MSGAGPRFDDLLGEELGGEERERLRRVHDLLIEAGAPPELSPALQTPPAGRRAYVVPLPPRRRWRTASVLAAAVALALFGAGWLFGSRSTADGVRRTVAMAGPGGARASLAILAVDRAGNWPMEVKVRGLATLPHGQTYTLWLTKRGRLEAQCGTFAVGPGETAVRLNAPYHLSEYDGWVVVRTGTARPLLTTSVT